MGCGAAEPTGLGFVCFVVITPCVLSANRVDLCFFVSQIFHPPTLPTPPAQLFYTFYYYRVLFLSFVYWFQNSISPPPPSITTGLEGKCMRGFVGPAYPSECEVSYGALLGCPVSTVFNMSAHFVIFIIKASQLWKYRYLREVAKTLDLSYLSINIVLVHFLQTWHFRALLQSFAELEMPQATVCPVVYTAGMGAWDKDDKQVKDLQPRQDHCCCPHICPARTSYQGPCWNHQVRRRPYGLQPLPPPHCCQDQACCWCPHPVSLRCLPHLEFLHSFRLSGV